MRTFIRLYIIWALLILILAGLIWRLIDLSVNDRTFLLKQSQARILRKISIPAYRGMIKDRLGSPLAISTPVDSVWINPQSFKPTSIELQQIATILGISTVSIHKTIQTSRDRQFIYLKRGNPPDIADQIKLLNIPGIYTQREYRRYYPESEVAAHVVGITNVDDQGQEGLELAYNAWLGGTPGLKEVLKDRLGHIIANLELLQKPKQGKDLTLSIDHRIQYLAYSVLKQTVTQYHAQAGSIVVLDVKTGEIIAMVNQPSYNPNNRPKNHDDRYRNRAVTDSFEPGSVIKPFTIALALNSGKYTAETTIDTNPGWMKIGGYRIRDDLNYGVVNLTQLLQKSSNIAAAKVLLSLDPTQYFNLLSDLGFGQRTESGFPGEESGRLVLPPKWVPSVIATLAYGYGISVTALQLAHGYATLANGGISMPMTFLKVDHPPEGKRVLPEKVANSIVKMLQMVLQSGGTGTQARIPGYTVAGKTGTAYIAGPNGYDKLHYMSSFIGMAPAENPQIVVAVVIRDPRGEHFGGLVAAPAFAKVMGGALRLLDIPPS